MVTMVWVILISHLSMIFYLWIKKCSNFIKKSSIMINSKSNVKIKHRELLTKFYFMNDFVHRPNFKNPSDSFSKVSTCYQMARFELDTTLQNKKKKEVLLKKCPFSTFVPQYVCHLVRLSLGPLSLQVVCTCRTFVGVPFFFYY